MMHDARKKLKVRAKKSIWKSGYGKVNPNYLTH